MTLLTLTMELWKLIVCCIASFLIGIFIMLQLSLIKDSIDDKESKDETKTRNH